MKNPVLRWRHGVPVILWPSLRSWGPRLIKASLIPMGMHTILIRDVKAK